MRFQSDHVNITSQLHIKIYFSNNVFDTSQAFAAEGPRRARQTVSLQFCCFLRAKTKTRTTKERAHDDRRALFRHKALPVMKSRKSILKKKRTNTLHGVQAYCTQGQPPRPGAVNGLVAPGNGFIRIDASSVHVFLHKGATGSCANFRFRWGLSR